MRQTPYGSLRGRFRFGNFRYFIPDFAYCLWVIAMENKVKVYSTPTCPWCRRVKEYLTQNRIRFEDADVSTDRAAAEEMIKKSGQMGVPVTEIDGELVVGFDKPTLDKKLGLSP